MGTGETPVSVSVCSEAAVGICHRANAHWQVSCVQGFGDRTASIYGKATNPLQVVAPTGADTHVP